MYIPKVVCEPCGFEMRVLEIGVLVEFKANSEAYYKISADRYQCGNCQAKVLTGFARVPLSESFQSDYNDWIARYEVSF